MHNKTLPTRSSKGCSKYRRLDPGKEPVLIKLLIYCCTFLFYCNAAFGKDLGVVGRTYSIAERDALSEIEGRSAQVNWKKQLDKIKPEKYRPKDTISLPRAKKNATRMVDMTYTLDMDIPDGKGGILYPRGYTFNPLDYLEFKKTLVVINAQDKDQVAWFKKSQYAKRIDVMLLVTAGSWLRLAESLDRPVFYADSRISRKFKLRFVPSVVRQSGRMMEVDEYAVPRT